MSADLAVIRRTELNSPGPCRTLTTPYANGADELFDLGPALPCRPIAQVGQPVGVGWFGAANGRFYGWPISSL